MAQEILSAERVLEALVFSDVALQFAAIQQDGNQAIRIDYANGYQRLFNPRVLRLVPNPAGYVAEQLSINCKNPGIHLQVAAESGKIQAMIGSAEDQPKSVNMVKFADCLKRIATLLEHDE